MKRILMGAVVLAGAFALAACSGSPGAGSTTGGGAVAAGAGGGAPSATAVTPSATAVTPSATAVTTPATSSSPSPVSSPPSSPAGSPKTTPATKTTPPKPKPAASTANVPCAKAASAGGTSACVDLSAHRAWLLQDGKIVYGPVSMLPGQKANPTPTGTFHVLSREKMHYSREFDDAKMPNSVFFYPGDAFHTGSLKAYSHGCVHLSATSSLKFFNTLAVGDLVQVVP
ncbi:L,D-transpeptidase [Amycolatopsis sp. PS_44_ISF1]|uniref:L,D-transpeptidase n=1 Tax=Amycolatopsis sp. PS_44_ISF1 TaxID=2974917 RepID=UPI0028DF0574|nr:L,D-transpeptidase [Amycolatopsis sp. PS_44_ISF1]MDT8910792.1 L,D-transpeptidase [Amycolatopsis sp. PS_44_ISF1]